MVGKDPMATMSDVRVSQMLARLRRDFAAKHTENERRSMDEERLREFCRLNNPGQGEHDFALAVEQFVVDPEGLIPAIH